MPPSAVQSRTRAVCLVTAHHSSASTPLHPTQSAVMQLRRQVHES
jgi:hypothetical protein